MPRQPLSSERVEARLVALFILGALLLLPPVLLVFNVPARVLGVPVLYLYIFAAWAGLIALAAAIARHMAREGASAGQGRDLEVANAPAAEPRGPDA